MAGRESGGDDNVPMTHTGSSGPAGTVTLEVTRSVVAQDGEGKETELADEQGHEHEHEHDYGHEHEHEPSANVDEDGDEDEDLDEDVDVDEEENVDVEVDEGADEDEYEDDDEDVGSVPHAPKMEGATADDGDMGSNGQAVHADKNGDRAGNAEAASHGEEAGAGDGEDAMDGAEDAPFQEEGGVMMSAADAWHTFNSMDNS